jgi:cytidine deaminase
MSKTVDPQALDALFSAARAARLKAYAPYSRFRVGAAVMDEQGRIHSGCNVENAAYPSGTCAEAGAIAAMCLAGGQRIAAVAVIGETDAPCAPCGNCRQRLREFAMPGLQVHLIGQTGPGQSHAFSALLPHAFGPEMLP